MSEPERIRQEIVEIIAEIAELSPEEVSPEATLEELKIDSLNGLRIVAEVEKRYGVNIPEEEIVKIRTISEILALVDVHSPKE